MLQVITIENRNGVAVVDSRLVAEGLGIQHMNLLDTIRKYQATIEGSFGKVAFETQPSANSATNQNLLVAHLSKEQAEFIATLSKNTPDVIAFKAALVSAFNKQQPAKAISTAQLFAMQAQVNLELEERLATTDEKLLQVASQVDQVVNELRPAAENYAQLVSSDDAVGVSEAAKILSFKGMGERKLYEYMRAKKVVTQSNLPSQRQIDEGRMRIDSSGWWLDKFGTKRVSKKCVITRKGIEYLMNKLKRDGYQQNQVQYLPGNLNQFFE